jgi:serine/threonine-protein kinase
VLTSTAGELLVKVLDFGIAKQRMAEYDSLTGAANLIGTPEYMSPEQIVSARDVDHSADIWALAVLAYEALVGRVPFSGETIGGLIVAITSSSFVTPGSCGVGGRNLDAVFARAFARAPGQRFASARELAAALQSAVGIEPTASGEWRALPTTGTEPGKMRPPIPSIPTVPAGPVHLEPLDSSAGHEERTVLIDSPNEAPAVTAFQPSTFGGATRTVPGGRDDRRMVALLSATAVTVVLMVIGLVLLFGRSADEETTGQLVPAVGPMLELVLSTEHEEVPTSSAADSSATADPTSPASATPSSAKSSAAPPAPKPRPSAAAPRNRKGRLGF